MNLNKSTRYALYAAMDMARAWPRERVTVAQVARRYGISGTALAKVFQRLVRARLSRGSRGVGGGYELARGPGEVTVLDVIEAFEAPRRPRQCLLDDRSDQCRDFGTCRLRRLFDEVDEMARATFASTSLETLSGGR
jgi:Rrf2 family protein